MPQHTKWEMVGLWNDWKNDVSTLRIMEEGISESCDGDLHTIYSFFCHFLYFRGLEPYLGF